MRGCGLIQAKILTSCPPVLRNAMEGGRRLASIVRSYDGVLTVCTIKNSNIKL
jgi:hypothetical protein